jgi:aspartyl/asparaginyl beta-hydroxylase (cupin superfamily)
VAVSTSHPRSVSNDILAAFRAKDRERLRALLSTNDTESLDREDAWLMVGQVQMALQDEEAADAAFLRHLDRHPRDLATLLFLGDARARNGDDRAATTFYRTALNVASQPGYDVPAPLRPRIGIAQTYLADVARRFDEHLRATVSQEALPSGTTGARLRTAVDLLLGKQQLYLQQPSMFYFPGLPQRAFFERGEFDWLPELEAATPQIRAELEALMAAQSDFEPYVQATPGRPAPSNPLLNDDSWSARYLWRNGEIVGEAASRCPVTMEALKNAPIPEIVGRSPMALFSVLRPGTHIRPHHGLLNTRLIVHLPIIAPSGCGLRVGAETRTWEAGRALIFDDSFEHEAWNRGTSTRTVLLFEIWRPDITPEEREVLTRIFETIDTYRSAPRDEG